jgi:predicted GH43/DUF377 family glycosyl hydrolase
MRKCRGDEMRKWRVGIIAALIALLFFSAPLSSIVRADDWTQTTQSDFEAGSGANIDTISYPGNVTLAQHWQKYPTSPVLNVGPSPWDSTYVDSPSVLYDGITYRMWYSGSAGTSYQIGLATSNDGISWTKSGSNPVLGPGPSVWESDRVYFPTVLFIGGNYHMWYTGDNGTNDRIGYATSPDGVTWIKSASNPVLDIGLPGSWDNNNVLTPVVIHDGSTYHMWYSGYNGSTWRIGYATSSDGIVWNKYAFNPVLDLGPPGSWDGNHVYYPSVIFDGATYHMWYSGADGINARIGYATSSDGITWTRQKSNPLIDVGPPGAWDDQIIWFPSVIKQGSGYKMWYGAKDGTTYRIGYATSPDGITWTKVPNDFVLNIGSPVSWENTDVFCPTVLYNGIVYEMWYTGSENSPTPHRIGYANSPDGITWSRSASNPVLDIGLAAWDDVSVFCPNVLFDGLNYHMWYTGSDGSRNRIGYATSPDGITWMKNAANPVLDVGSSGSWDDLMVRSPTVIHDGAIYHMWFSGHDGSTYRIGYATSPDGITWTKYSGNPVFDFGSPGSWDDSHVTFPSVVQTGSAYHMWYSGVDSFGIGRIGHARSSDGSNWTRNPANPVIREGHAGSWDDLHAYNSCVLYDSGSFSIWYAGSDGTAFRIGHTTMGYWRSGNLSSQVFDSGIGGTIWNSINWTESLPPGTNITIATRSGNTPTPDVTWSSWSTEMWNELGTVIASPASRFIQYRATFANADRDVTPILSHVNINYTLAVSNPPTIADLLENPNPQEVFGFVNITANITDDIAVDEVWINISGEGNFSMTFDSISGLYYYEASYSALAIFSYTIWASDTQNQWASSSSSFIIHDTTPPVITNVFENPNPQDVFGNVNITANITDNYALNEVWINIFGEGNFSMIFDPASGFYTYEAPYSSIGTYSYTIWANDTSDNWASTSSSFVIQDVTPPAIANILENPDPQEVYGIVNISANVTDNYALDEVWINISGLGNFTMMFDSISGLHYYENSYSILGTSSYTIWANDTSNQWSSASSSFTIQDSAPPIITDILENPDPQEVFSNIEITANITDNYAVDEVSINIPGEGNFSMAFNSITGLYHYEDSFSSLGVQSFTIWANDTSGNWAFSSSSFVIQDSTPPEISDLVETPDPQEVNKEIRVSAVATDNIGIDEVWINIEGIGNFTMNYNSSADKYYYETIHQISGTFIYTIWAKDTSNNWNSASSSFMISEQLDEKPVLDWWWILLVIIIIILIIIILFLLMRRRKKEEEEEPSSQQIPSSPPLPPQSMKQEQPHTPPPPPPPPPSN